MFVFVCGARVLMLEMPTFLVPLFQEKYGAKADVWALGCAMYTLAALAPPFTGARHVSRGYSRASMCVHQLCWYVIVRGFRGARSSW
jgi:hypothetical protein